jgi:RNA 2',3'-cyclic 3'-phosphodiesterase
VAEHAIEPVSWTVTGFRLVHSLLGQTRHITLGEWRLEDVAVSQQELAQAG